LKSRNHSKSANGENKPHLRVEVTFWVTADQSRNIEGDLGQEPADSFHLGLCEIL
jgi:hypothetical protein